MWVEEGFVGFMRGNGTNVIRIVPYSAVQFASYEQFKKVRSQFSPALPQLSVCPSVRLSVYLRLSITFCS
jgi:hypothetical protein